MKVDGHEKNKPKTCTRVSNKSQRLLFVFVTVIFLMYLNAAVILCAVFEVAQGFFLLFISFF